MKWRSKPILDLAVTNTVIEVGQNEHEIHSLEAQNINAVDIWLHLWDALEADVTIGVTAPTLSFLVPAGDGALYGAMDKSFPVPVGFNKGLCYACTDAKDGSGAAPAVAVVLNMGYRKIRKGE